MCWCSESAIGVGTAEDRCYDFDMRSAIKIDPDIQGGTPCFSGTRVPVRSLFDALARGRSVDYFLTQFPAVTRQQVARVLEQAGRRMSETPAGK